MKITEEQIESVEKDPYANFLDGCRSERTKETYDTCLKKALMDHFDKILLAQTYTDRVAEFVDRSKDDPKWLGKVLKNVCKRVQKKV